MRPDAATFCHAELLALARCKATRSKFSDFFGKLIDKSEEFGL
jgi:hypothetical protein